MIETKQERKKIKEKKKSKNFAPNNKYIFFPLD